jgi:hypothetical protein
VKLGAKMSDENRPKPIDVTKINLDLMKLKVTDIPGIIEYAHTVGGFSITPSNEGQIKSHARDAMKEQTEEQLGLIFEQMRTLAKQVQDIQNRVYISDLIYNAEIKFTPVIGKNYYLYETDNGSRTLSLISPAEWKDKLVDTFIAEVRLNADHTWKVITSSKDIKI